MLENLSKTVFGTSVRVCKRKSTIENLNRALRKERDSNPRYGQAVQRISSPPHSVTLASFLVCKNLFL